ncbi:MAG: NAD(P)H-dependent glycerol-3-phosphate dehydrogenase [Hydrogenibacillus schlegelii]|uniref:Glycerol-3-phosphate dehydrogenase [NAD(P)+] n=1 Tax=Hydrogenibacillus schlegelii TaxID=1484 RepID=A0A947G886_HYDSH|nr:NAD(P)H-dependent glycerol-3-phosphate dehydrogenase [Hydrogenibacillus schlegelii]
MADFRRVAVVGAGSFGTALAQLIFNNGHEVVLWGRDPAHVRALAETRENRRYLPGVLLPPFAVTADLAEAVSGASAVLFVVPSQAMRSVAAAAAAHLSPAALVVSAAKGLERKSLKRMSEVLRDVLGARTARIVALSGPSHAEEVARGMPTSVVVAGAREDAREAQGILFRPTFRVYTNDDLVGVELAGALKNVIALAAGLAEGYGYGDNARAALITRGLHEIARLGVHLGAAPMTFAGLAGIGDLVVTATSEHSRNRRAGRLIGRGVPPDEALRSIGMVVEGVVTTEAAYALAARHGVSMPITEALYRVLFRGEAPAQAIEALLSREPTEEGAMPLLETWVRARRESGRPAAAGGTRPAGKNASDAPGP